MDRPNGDDRVTTKPLLQGAHHVHGSLPRDDNRDAGTTDIDYLVVREGKNLKGRFFEGVFRTVGKSKLEKAFVNSVKAIEADSRKSATATAA